MYICTSNPIKPETPIPPSFNLLHPNLSTYSMHTRNYFSLFVLLFFMGFCPSLISAQEGGPIARQVEQYAAQYRAMATTSLFEVKTPPAPLRQQAQEEVKQAAYLQFSQMGAQQLLRQRPEQLKLKLPVGGGEELILRLYQSQPLSDDFILRSSSRTEEATLLNPSLHYWGIVENNPNSLTAISISAEEVMGFIHLNGRAYSLGLLNSDQDLWHVLYEADDLSETPSAVCEFDPKLHDVKTEDTGEERMMPNPDNCVRMYVESDYSIFLDKGSVSATTSYVSGVFNQVSILFANENINLVVNEIFVWSSPDPYTGPSASNYLTQFRNNLNGNFNGDLAHLVGYGGGGGVAYVGTLCNPNFGVAYSGIGSSYNLVPTYSWTVNVVAHEIGHNIGSSHTHACAWNGNNTAIDDCGPTAGYSEGCNNAPTPNAGTIMSYCHLVGGVGIDFNLGFGPQPGDLLRNNVYNAPCLQPCGINPTIVDAGISAVVAPTTNVCGSSTQPEVVLANYGNVDLTSVQIQYNVNGASTQTFPWSGNLAPGATANIFLPSISFPFGLNTFSANTTSPNNTVDADPSNNGSNSSFTAIEPTLFFADLDGDGFGDAGNPVFACAPAAGYVENAEDCNDSDPAIFIGATCDDGDSCTVNDAYDVDCECVGELEDEDGDGICDSEDQCPELDDNLIGTACDDGDACTENDVYTDDCECVGTAIDEFDSDNDGVCDEADVCPGFDDNLIGTACDDGDSCTVDDIYTEDCDCAGTFADSDEDGVCDSEDNCPDFDNRLIGTACDDGNDCTENDVYTDDCECAGTLIDEDEDGICDEDDICPGFDDNLIGMACDDGNPCTVDDTYTQDCACVGTFVDSDGDGVCDAEDICPEGDDTVDTNEDGIPDDCICDTQTDSFAVSSLTHQGDSSSLLVHVFEPNTLDPTFTIDDLSIDDGETDSNTDLVTIEYITVTGDSLTYGSFSADSLDYVEVMLEGAISSLSISLRDGSDGLAADSMSVGLSTITYCELVLLCEDRDGDDICDEEDSCPDLDNSLIGTACDDGNPCTFNDVYTEDCACAGELRDRDNDGVCDLDDICPDGDDRIDENENGIPDACESCGPQQSVALRPNPLTNFGNNVSYAIEVLPPNHFDVAFQITGLDATFSSQGGGPYIDYVTVEYQDGNGNTQMYGNFNGTSTSTINVFIPGEVSSISVILTNTFPGDVQSSVQAIQFSDIIACVSTAETPMAGSSPVAPASELLPNSEFTLFPNPALDQATLKLERPTEAATITVRSITGTTIARYQISGAQQFRLPIREWGQQTSGCFFITLQRTDAAPVTKRLIIAR